MDLRTTFLLILLFTHRFNPTLLSQHIIYRVEIKGQEKTDIAKIFINQSVFGHHDFQIELATDYTGTNTSKFDDARKMIGSTILVEFESKLEENKKSQFKGIITNVGLSQQDSSTSQILLKGFSPTIMMEGLKNSKAYMEKSLSDIFNDIVKQQPSNVLGNSNNSSKSDIVKYTLQINESDYNFLSRQAQKFGEWMFYDGQQVNLGMPSSPNEHKLEIGGHISDVEIHMNTEPLGQKYGSYDYLRNETDSVEIEGELKTSGLLSEAKDYSKNIYSSKAHTFNPDISDSSKNAKKKVESKASSLTSDFMMVNGTTAHPGMKIGDIVEILTSDESYGKFIIISLNHSLVGTSQYENHFTAISSEAKAPSPNYTIEQPVLHSTFAKVIDNNDPDALGRIKVGFAWSGEKIETDWIPVIQGGAGEGYGNYFVPEISDLVVVNFEFGNPDLPYISGAAYHKDSKPSEFFHDKNYYKAIYTKGENQVFISDEPGKEKIAIINPKEQNKIILDCQDKSILIESVGDINIKGKNITLDAKETLATNCKNFEHKADKASTLESMDITLNSSKNLSMTGTAKAEIKSTGKASLAGTASSELKSSGIVQVQGSLVKIN